TGFVQLRLDSVPLLREAVGKVCHDLRNQLIATANGLFRVVDEAALYRDPSRAVSLCQLRGKERHREFVLLGARYAHGRQIGSRVACAGYPLLATSVSVLGTKGVISVIFDLRGTPLLIGGWLRSGSKIRGGQGSFAGFGVT